jgi:hypothetical protein
MTPAHINSIATATPQHDVHHTFIDFAANYLAEGTGRKLFRRMARLSAIEHRYSFVNPSATANGSWLDAESVYVSDDFPSTARHMQLFERFAPQLAHSTPDNLSLTDEERRRITHVLDLGAVTICFVRLSAKQRVAEKSLPLTALSLSRFSLDEALLSRTEECECKVRVARL